MLYRTVTAVTRLLIVSTGRKHDSFKPSCCVAMFDCVNGTKIYGECHVFSDDFLYFSKLKFSQENNGMEKWSQDQLTTTRVVVKYDLMLFPIK